MDKRERAQRAKQEDALLNRVLAWIAEPWCWKLCCCSSIVIM